MIGRWTGVVAGVLATSGVAMADGPSPRLGDVTDRMVAIANPLAELRVPVLQRVVGDVAVWGDRLWIAYGNTGNSTPKWLATIDPRTGEVGREGPGGRPFNAERLGRFRAWGESLAVVIDDQFGNREGIGATWLRNPDGGWRRIDQNGSEDHNGDAFLFDGQVFLGSRNTGQAAPRARPSLSLAQAPADAPSGRFVESPHRIDWRPPESLARFFVPSFFVFRGVLYGSTRHGSDLPFAQAKLFDPPYLLAYDPALEPKAWRLAHGEPESLYPPGSLYLNPAHQSAVAHALHSIVAFNTADGPRLAMIGTRRRDDDAGSRSCLYIASDLRPEAMVRVPLPGLPGDEAVRMRALRVDGGLAVVSALRLFGDRGTEPDTVWLHRCDDLERAAHPAAWSWELTFRRDGFALYDDATAGWCAWVDGSWWFAESTRRPRDPATAGTVWGVNAEE